LRFDQESSLMEDRAKFSVSQRPTGIRLLSRHRQSARENRRGRVPGQQHSENRSTVTVTTPVNSSPTNPLLLYSVLYLAVATLTQFINNQTAVKLFFKVGWKLAVMSSLPAKPVLGLLPRRRVTWRPSEQLAICWSNPRGRICLQTTWRTAFYYKCRACWPRFWEHTYGLPTSSIIRSKLWTLKFTHSIN